jgi:TorA maturation chaperone TorD
MSARSGVYHLLATIYLRELDSHGLDILQREEPFRSLISGEEPEELIPRLRAEYTRLFLLNVFPYESAFVEDEAMLNTASTQIVVEAYRAGSFAPDRDSRVGALDHIGIELDFMSKLAEQESALGQRGAWAAAGELRAMQVHFLHAHLAAWGPVFAAAVARDARASLYRELALFTAEFLLADLDLLVAHTNAPLSTSEERGDQAECLPSIENMSLRELARRFTSPAAAGFHLSREELFRIAGHLQLPLAPVERWLMLEQLFQASARYHQLSPLLGALIQTAEHAAGMYGAWITRYPGAAGAMFPREARAQGSVALLRQMYHAGSGSDEWSKHPADTD